MIVVSKYRIALENGRKQTWEDINSNTLVNDIKPSAEFSPLGNWISHFLSFTDSQCKEYLNSYGFDIKVADDYLYPYNLFNQYLKNKPGDLESFQRLMTENHLKVPQFSYGHMDSKYLEKYECESIAELCTVLMYNVFRENKFFKKCEKLR